MCIVDALCDQRHPVKHSRSSLKHLRPWSTASRVSNGDEGSVPEQVRRHGCQGTKDRFRFCTAGSVLEAGR